MASSMTLQIIKEFLKLFQFSSEPFQIVLEASWLDCTVVSHM